MGLRTGSTVAELAVHLRALLPGGLREWAGAEVAAGRSEGWFGPDHCPS